MALNFNVQPYFDDFDPNKNFHRILFKPGAAVQARELTQSQTILQDQISKFASSIFSQNTPISGGKITTNLHCSYIKLSPTFQGASITASNFLNKLITDTATGTIVAKVIATSEATGIGAIGDPPTLIVSYISGTQFTDNDTIAALDGSNFQATVQPSSSTNSSTGLSSVASISEGVFYIVNGYNISNIQNSDGSYSKYSIGNFVSVPPQIIILDKYSNSPSYRVGLEIVETINDYIDDTSLLDPAVGASNYQAPGADRYIIKLNLITLPMSIGNDDKFIELLRIVDGVSVKQVDSTVYSTIDDYFAKRTYDTNGDYIVNQFKLTPAVNTDSSKYDIGISKGVAYVRGYRLENQSTLSVTGNRARTYDSVLQNNVSVDYGNFFYVDNLLGSSTNFFEVTKMTSIDLHSVPVANIVSTNANTYTSTLVGTARMRNLDFDYYANTAADTSSYVYKSYVFDINTNTLSSNVSSATTNTITFYDPFNRFSSQANAYVGVTLTIDSGASVGDTRKIVSYNGSTKTATVDQVFSTTVNSSATFSLRFAVKDVETVGAANTNYGIVSSARIANTGKVASLSTGDTVLHDAGYPELIFNIGEPYVRNSANGAFETTNYFTNKSFNAPSGGGGGSECQIQLDSVDINVLNFKGRTGSGVNLTASEVLAYYTVIVKNKGTNSGLVNGKILDFTAAGRSVHVSDDKNTVTFTATDLSPSLTVDIIAKVYASDSLDSNQHILRIKNLVANNQSTLTLTSGTVVNGNTYVDLTNAQVYIKKGGIVAPGKSQSLYVSDVKRIVKIIDTGSAATAATTAMLTDTRYDVTSNYSFTSGQTDNYYDHASISLRPGAPVALGNLLVLFDYYSHVGGDGYFNVLSYTASAQPELYAQIPSYTAKSGIVYQLRDCLDFRPTRVNAVSTFTFRYTNPSAADAGVYIPDNLSTYINNYSYYLGRKDLLVLTKDRSFQLLEGVPSINPSFPTQPDGALVIGKFNLDPYTGYIPGEAPIGTLPNLSVESVQHKRWTMQDISDLQTRVNNLEYYTALNALEMKASSTQVPDVNGLNRFKNGILVDDFSSFSTADTANREFSCNIDKITSQLTAKKTVDNFALQNPAVYNSIGNLYSTSGFKVSTVNKTTNLFTLPYTTANVITQQLASSTVNLNPFAVVIAQGTLDLNPPMDNWVDNKRAPDLLIVDPSMQVFQQSDSVNVLSTGAWKAVVGTATQDLVTQTTSSFSVANHGAFNGPFGTNIGYTETNTTTTTQTYGTLGQTNILGYYKNINNTYNLNSNYITDVSIIPYIRPQELLIKAKNLLTNTPVTVTFDGVDIGNNITTPDVVELMDVHGNFAEGDVIGYTSQNQFYPLATVTSVYNYPISLTGRSNTRLYITGNFHSTLYNSDNNIPNPIIHNAKYDSNGNVLANTAFGSSVSSKVVEAGKTGQISTVGGSFTDTLGSTLKYYRVWPNGYYGPCVAAWGIWGNPNARGASVSNPSLNGIPYGKFNFTAPKAGTYYMRWVNDDNQYGFIKINGVAIVGGGNANDAASPSNLINGWGGDYTVTLLEGTNTFEIYCRATDNDNSFLGCAISASPWKNQGAWGQTSAYNMNTETAGPIVLSTASLPVAAISVSAGTDIQMPGGGIYYVGATTVSLNGIASSTDGFYNGCKITFQSTYVSLDPYGKSVVETKPYTATITSYTALGCVCTLDTPVNLSIGNNSYTKTDVTSTYAIVGTHTSYQLGVKNGGLDKFSTDETGTFTGIFRIPQGTFKTGERVVRVDNRTVPADPGSATSFAEATFTASGLSTQSQSLNFGASVSGASRTFSQTNYLTNQLLYTNTVVAKTYTPYDPVAQSFMVQKENYPNGVFLDSVDLFFKSKPTTTNVPITFSIVQTLNGYPSGQTLDYSVVTVSSDMVKVKDTPHYLDPAAKTRFQFPAPVYIQPGVLYAFILQTSSTDYNVYLAAQNATALPSTVKANYTDATPTTITKIGAVPGIGGLFESQNGMTWTADQSKTLMMTINRCVFDTSSAPTIDFIVPKGLPYRKSTSGDIKSLAVYDSPSTATTSQAVGDVLCDAFNLTTTDFTPTTTNIGYLYKATLNNGHTYTSPASITPGKYASPTYSDIHLSDGLGERILIANANASFVLSASLSSGDNAVSPVLCDDGLTLYNINYDINNLELSNTQIVLVSGGSGYNSATPNANVVVSAPDIVGGSQAFAAANVVNGVIQSIYFTNVGSGYLQKPSITITSPNTSPATVNVYSEFSPTGGNAQTKYFTKKVVMAAGNDSQDLRVFYTAYRPTGTNIYVFYKVLDANDPSKFDDNGWNLMTTIGQNKNVYSSTRNDLYEFEAAPGIGGVADNYLTYQNSNGQSYNSFIQFAIKIVMTTNDKTAVPFLTDIRALALPSGTGI